VQRKPESGVDPESAPVVTQYEMHGVEELGLLKMDFLGLRNLDVITDTVEMVRATKDPAFDADAIALDDDKTLELLRRGDSVGVFQLEGGPMRALMRSLAPTSFDDVAALVALYRPGPMAANMHNDYADRKNGRQPITYLHPDAEEILAPTMGLCIYQELIMRVAQKFAGYSLSEADNLRKACGKKVRELIAKERTKFVAGCAATGYGEEIGKAWFDIIEPFADYAFNKSHAYGYGYIAYQTAYLKAHYPVEYLSCLLSSVKTNLDKAAVYLAECRSSGVPVIVPDINRSSLDFAPIALDDGKEGIVFGLSAVRNVGEGLVRLVLDEREKNGPFTDFYDFCDRVDLNVLNKRTLESLIKAGAFDGCGHKRRGLLLVFEQIVDKTISRRRREAEGQFDLFSMAATENRADVERAPIPDLEFDKAQRLAFEKEMLGLYVSDHPLFGAEAAIRRKSDCALADLVEKADGEVVNVAGVVTGLQRKYTKKGDLMAVFVLEDLQATAEVMVFPRVMAEHGHKLVDDAIVVVKGRIDGRDDVPKVMAMDIAIIEVVPDAAPPVRVNLPPSRASESIIDKLKNLLAEHPGESPVFLHLGERKVLRLPDAFCVDVTNGLVGELRVLLGADAVF
jgi:DNA polymerase-3 subunit alpha